MTPGPIPPLDTLRHALAGATAEVAATIPPGQTETLLALLRADERLAHGDELTRVARPGWNLALRLCLERADGGPAADASAAIAAWVEGFLTDCDQLARASLTLAESASGHVQLQQRAPGAFVAWQTSKRCSPEQRERADFDWWSQHLARQVAPQFDALRAERPRIRLLLGQEGDAASGAATFVPSNPAIERHYRELGRAHVARFANQHSYPPDTAIGGATFAQYGELLALLIGWLYQERDRRAPNSDEAPTAFREEALIAALARAMDADAATVGHALQCFILDRENTAYHSALAGRAAPPLIRLDAERLVWSARGLLGEPFIFLTRELRRRHAQEYHNSAHLREGVFRRDLYRLFSDKRFVVSAGRVELKRSGEARTDLDALVFDRKTGTLGVFELKAQDPFARSVEERQRQRDNFFHANRQVSAILEWVQRRGADDLLVRFDESAAKRFRVQKVHVFVLGRYLAHFAGGPEPDRRAAWGSWPEVLRITGDRPFAADARNPLSTLFTRLRDAPSPAAPADTDHQEIAVGGLRVRVFPSFTDMRAALDGSA
jgi:hypothetical protein